MFSYYKEKSIFEAYDKERPYLVACTADSSRKLIQKCKLLGFEKVIDFLTV